MFESSYSSLTEIFPQVLEETNSEQDSKFFVLTLNFSKQPAIELEPALLTTGCLLTTLTSTLINLPFSPGKPL